MSALESGEIHLSHLVETYKQMQSSMHKGFALEKVDINALTYSLTRIPRCFFYAETLLLGQHISDFQDKYFDVTSWQNKVAPDRRRQVLYNRDLKTIITLLTSDSDIDDIINILIAFQIEWQKIGKILSDNEIDLVENENFKLLGINESDWKKLKIILGNKWKDRLLATKNIKDINIILVSHSDDKYRQTVSSWWNNIFVKSFYLDFPNLPVYFISSNLHSLVNIIGRYVIQKEDDIFYYIHQKHPDLEKEWQSVKDGNNQLRITDFLYYISAQYFRSHPIDFAKKTEYENGLGIKRIQSANELLCNAQIIPVSIFSKLPEIDPALTIKNIEKISKSNAVIINIDYPLGFAAYYIFKEILTKQKNLKGLYFIGKAAILSGEIGDIQIPSSVFDERTGNIFQINNCFNNDFPLISKQSRVFLNQKSICVHSPYLENDNQLKGYTEAGFNIIEMESGPLLTSISEWQTNKEIPQNIICNVGKLPFDYGIINYASDNPLVENLGEGPMAIRGVEPTYLATISTIQRILDLESI